MHGGLERWECGRPCTVVQFPPLDREGGLIGRGLGLKVAHEISVFYIH